MPDTYMKKFYFPSLAAALAFVGFASSQNALADAIEASTADSPKWFRVYTPNRSNLTFTSNGVGNKFNGTSDATKPYGKNMLWRFEANDDGTYTIINMDGTYVSPNQFEAYGSNNAFVGVSEKPEKGWTVTAISGKTDLYTIANGTIIGGNLWVTESTKPGDRIVQAKRRKNAAKECVVRPEDYGGL